MDPSNVGLGSTPAKKSKLWLERHLPVGEHVRVAWTRSLEHQGLSEGQGLCCKGGERHVSATGSCTPMQVPAYGRFRAFGFPRTPGSFRSSQLTVAPFEMILLPQKGTELGAHDKGHSGRH